MLYASRWWSGRVSVEDCARTFRAPLAELLYLPIFIAAIRSFDPVGEGHRSAQIGRLVVRRAHWSAPVAELPDDLAGWARERLRPLADRA